VGSGGKLSSDDVGALRTAGCVVEFFHPLRPWMLDTINNRTHRRLLVVDGRIGFTGGAGIADVWLGHAEEMGHWRDTHVQVGLSNSYFLPDDDARALLVAAARRGVDVRILVPGKANDVPATRAGGRASFGELLEGGVKIFEYGPTMFHAKTMVVDGTFVTIGSTNFDHRSFRLNDEINLTVYDREVGRRLEEMFVSDLARSHSYLYEQWRHRPLKERLSEWLVMPFRSEL
jgi:phosphatidylserine/phosphatidylglycerophosphate/cardiolipin synthase-like enzyme